MKRFAIVMAAAIFLGSCDAGPPLADKVPEGQGFQGTGSFSTEKMMSMCVAANTAGDDGTLRGMSDEQVANGTCEMTALAAEMIGRHADPSQVCVGAAFTMMKEFKRRWPGHDPKEVIGRC